MTSFFPSWKVINLEPISDDGNLFLYHPHGMTVFGLTLNINSDDNFF